MNSGSTLQNKCILLSSLAHFSLVVVVLLKTRKKCYILINWSQNNVLRDKRILFFGVIFMSTIHLLMDGLELKKYQKIRNTYDIAL